MADLNSFYKDLEQKMQKSIDSLNKDLAKIRTDRAHPNVLEGIQVEYYNQRTALIQIAGVTIEDSRTLNITPFDKSSIGNIEKAIIAANLGFNPLIVGSSIKIVIPPLTEERRKSLVKQVKADVEAARVAVRNIRRDGNLHIKSLSTSKTISLNEKESAENRIQKITDQCIQQIDKICATKEADLMRL
jgi:ribosome recycling factor